MPEQGKHFRISPPRLRALAAPAIKAADFIVEVSWQLSICPHHPHVSTAWHIWGGGVRIPDSFVPGSKHKVFAVRIVVEGTAPGQHFVA